MNVRKTVVGLAGLGVVASLFMSSVALAQTGPNVGTRHDEVRGAGRMGAMMPGVFGTVASVSGTNFTVASKMMGKPGATTTPATTYTVDASAATVVKAGGTSTVSSIAVGDMVMVTGTVNGTNVTATAIRDGIPSLGKPGTGRGPGAMGKVPASIIQGNGQPVVGGSIVSVSGTMLSVATAKGGLTYSVDASGAVIQKGNATSSVSSIVVGDNVIVQGSVSGTAITASSIVDSGTRPASNANAGAGMPHPKMGGFFGAIDGFIQHLFGFF